MDSDVRSTESEGKIVISLAVRNIPWLVNSAPGQILSPNLKKIKYITHLKTLSETDNGAGGQRCQTTLQIQ